MSYVYAPGNVPFFVHNLVSSQALQNGQALQGGPIVTLKYPSDSEDHDIL